MNHDSRLTASAPTGPRAGLQAFAALVLLLVAFCAATLPSIVRDPLFDADEGRSGEVAREMAERGDFLMPYLNGVPYIDKPVVYFGSEAVAIAAFGANEFAVRLPSLLFSIGTIVVAFFFARSVLGDAAAVVSGIALVGSPMILIFARTAILDSALAFFMTCAIVALYYAIESDDVARSRRMRILAWACIALGILTKGPVALLLPPLVALPYAIWRRRAGRIVSVPAIVIAAAIVAPWVWYVQRQVPDFLQYVFVTETFRRLATSQLHRTGPVWYFIPILLAGAFPSFFLAISAGISEAREKTHDHRAIFLLGWIVLPLIFFSLSKSKLPQYVLPTMPPFALLAGWLIARRGRLPGIRFVAAVYAVAGAALLAFASAGTRRLHADPAVIASGRALVVILGAALVVSGIAILIAKAGRAFAMAALVIPMLLIPIAAHPLVEAIGDSRSTRDLAEKLRGIDAPIVGVGSYRPSLSFYMKRPFMLSSMDGSELRSNYVPLHFTEWSRTPGTTLFASDWWRTAASRCDRPRLFLLKSKAGDQRAELARSMPLVGEAGDAVLYGPCRSAAGGPK